MGAVTRGCAARSDTPPHGHREPRTDTPVGTLALVSNAFLGDLGSGSRPRARDSDSTIGLDPLVLVDAFPRGLRALGFAGLRGYSARALGDLTRACDAL